MFLEYNWCFRCCTPALVTAAICQKLQNRYMMLVADYQTGRILW